MEDEKKEHVEKAGDLLKWVSNLSKTLSKEEGEKAEKADLPKQQVPAHFFGKAPLLWFGSVSYRKITLNIFGFTKAARIIPEKCDFKFASEGNIFKGLKLI